MSKGTAATGFASTSWSSAAGRGILDNVSEVMNTEDPLGWNFRAGAPLCLLAQDETWYPHFYRRVGTFHKHFKTGTVSFAIETRTYVSARNDEVLMAIELENRDSEPLTLTLLPSRTDRICCRSLTAAVWLAWLPIWQTSRGRGWNGRSHQRPVKPAISPSRWPPRTKRRPFTRRVSATGSGRLMLTVKRNSGGLSEPLPVLKTQSPQLDNLYKRCLASLAFCRWQRSDFRRQPTWVCGGFICVVTWDFSFSAYALNLIEPQAIRQTLRDVLDIGRMQASYIDIRQPRTLAPFLYIQEPFALRDLIGAYITITGDRTHPGRPGGRPLHLRMAEALGRQIE